MPSIIKKLYSGIAILIALLIGTSMSFAQDSKDVKPDADAPEVRIVIMDPLSAPLACDCVQGYAQRKYEKLAQHLAKKAGVKVKIVWSESLKTAQEELKGKPDLVIGKHSVVLAGAKENKMEVQPIAQLTNADGTTHQTGLVVVRQKDEAISAADLIGYRIFFGPKDCDEKHTAPIKFIKEMGGEVPDGLEMSEACSVAATQLMELDKEIKAAAIISSYAKPLLEGCGTIKKGDLRVIGETDPVPFITAFVNKKTDAALIKKIETGLLSTGENAELLKSLETKKGFVKFEKSTSKKPADTPESNDSGEIEKKN